MAPQKCQVCTHPETEEIDQQIVQGKAHTKIAEKYDGLDHQNIWRHAQNHLPEKLTRALQKKEQAHAENILDGIKDLLDRTKSILDDAEDAGQKTTALQAIREARNTYELLSKIAVKLREYQQEAQEKQEGYVNHHIKEGLKALSDDELKALIQLQAKVYSQSPDHVLDKEARYVVDFVNSYHSDIPPVNGDASMSGDGKNGFDAKHQQNSSQSKSPRNRPKETKNTKIEKDEEPEMIDDLDGLSLDDLDIEDNTIPDGSDDPDWMKKERRRQGY